MPLVASVPTVADRPFCPTRYSDLWGMDSIRLVVEGEPRPSLRAETSVRFDKTGRPFAHVYAPEANRRYEERVRAAVAEQYAGVPAPFFPVGVPLACRVRFVFSRPQAHFGSGRNAGVLKAAAPYWHTVKPDLDNLLKLLWDGLTPRVFAGDQQIVRLVDPCKVYVQPGGVPRTEVEFWVLEQPVRSPSAGQLALAA